MAKICIIADYIDNQYAGIYTYAKNLIENILKLDIKNEYYFLHSKKNNFFKNKNEILIKSIKIPGYETYRKFHLIPKILEKYNFDIVHDLSHIPPFTFKSKTKYKKIITIHDLTSIIFPKFHIKLSPFIHRLTLPYSLNNSDIIITNSNQTKQDIQNIYNINQKKIYPIYLGIKHWPKINLQKINYKYLLYVGTIEPRKNIETLLKAFYILKENYKIKQKLILIGKKGWRYKNIIKTINTHKYKDDIKFLNFISEEKLYSYYKQADIFIYPSIYEGFGLPVLEAMFFNIPTIISQNSALYEINQNISLFFETKNYIDLANKTYTLLCDNTLKNQIIERQKKHIKKFDFKNTAIQTIKIYEELFKKNTQ